MRIIKRLTLGGLAALVLALLLHPAAFAQTVGCGGSFVPSFNCLINGLWDFTPQNAQTAYDVPFKANGSEATGVVSKVVTLTNAQVLTLGATPVTLVAAPGIGKYVDVISVNLVFDYTAAYSSVGDVRCYWGSRVSGSACSATITASGFFDASADKAIRVSGVPDNTNPPVTNLAVVLQKVTLAEMAGGNAANTVRVVIHYRIVATSLPT
jgi:hypothetical protein